LPVAHPIPAGGDVFSCRVGKIACLTLNITLQRSRDFAHASNGGHAVDSV